MKSNQLHSWLTGKQIGLVWVRKTTNFIGKMSVWWESGYFIWWLSVSKNFPVLEIRFTFWTTILGRYGQHWSRLSNYLIRYQIKTIYFGSIREISFTTSTVSSSRYSAALSDLKRGKKLNRKKEKRTAKVLIWVLLVQNFPLTPDLWINPI